MRVLIVPVKENIKIKKDIFPGDYKFVEYKTEELIQPPLY
jgi:hypothetical protein